MGEKTAISWCDHTFNPFWGCWKIAPECKNCYADAHANRFAPGHWGRTAPRKFFGFDHWRQPLKWNEAAKNLGVRRKVFCGSMCDWAEVHPNPDISLQLDASRSRLFALIKDTPHLDWLLLTKRPWDVSRHLPWTQDAWRDAQLPWNNVWLGTTAGTRQTLRENSYELRAIPAEVHFISCEPLLEDIPREEWDSALSKTARCGEYPIDWLIVGDESGRGRRPCDLSWVRHARDSAQEHGVAFHFKQWNQSGKKVHLPILDGVRHAEFPA